MVYRALTVTLLSGTVFAGLRADAADPTQDQSEGVIVLRRCVVDHERVSLVGSSLNGVLKECVVEPGTEVKEGQLLGRLEDRDVRAEVQLREVEAGSDIEIRLSENKSALAHNRLKVTTLLARRNAASQEELMQHRLEAEAATLEVENAKHRRELAEAQLHLAKAVLGTREFASPHAGVVTAILKRRGEPVTPNMPVFKVVDADHLLVTGRVDVVDVWRVRVGQPVRIVPDIAGADLPVEREVFTGKIDFIDTQIDPMSQTCKVLAKCDNRRRLLRAGMEARMEFPTAGATAPAVGERTETRQRAAAGGN
jgi:RND family efflux transporter MFP subunit